MIKFYGKSLFFRRGTTLIISLSYACNFKCTYCSLKLPTGRQPHAVPIGIEDWKRIITNFPVKVKEVMITGGEPTLITWMPDLCNWLLNKCYHVTVFSNLQCTMSFKEIKNSYRFQIWATFHQEQDDKRFFDGAHQLLVGNNYNIRVGELGEKKLLPYSKLMLFQDNEGLKKPQFIYSPDGKLFTSCYDLYWSQSQ